MGNSTKYDVFRFSLHCTVKWWKILKFLHAENKGIFEEENIIKIIEKKQIIGTWWSRGSTGLGYGWNELQWWDWGVKWVMKLMLWRPSLTKVPIFVKQANPALNWTYVTQTLVYDIFKAKQLRQFFTENLTWISNTTQQFLTSVLREKNDVFNAVIANQSTMQFWHVAQYK